MKRKWNRYIFVVLFGLLSGLIFGQELYEDIEIVAIFKAGSGTGELGIMPNIDYSQYEGRGGVGDFFTNGPSALCFDEEGNLYIEDEVNERIVIYNNVHICFFIFISILFYNVNFNPKLTRLIVGYAPCEAQPVPAKLDSRSSGIRVHTHKLLPFTYNFRFEIPKFLIHPSVNV